MPRTSRRKNKRKEEQAEPQIKYCRTCIYARISRKDGGHGRKDSIYIQKQICMDYAKKHPEMLVSRIYEDNGVTGTTFEREAFGQLMEEVRAGRVDCIIVKDFARFGRDALDALDLIDVIFPSLNVRFISVLDGYDSQNPACVQDRVNNILKHFMNDYYAREVSAKLVQAHRQSREKGEYWGARPPYGYRWAEESKKKIVPDSLESKTVQDIFYWYVFDGMSSSGISKKLNGMGLPSPTESHEMRQYGKTKKERKIYWGADIVRRILQNPLYTGAAVYGKTRQMLCENIPFCMLPKDEWDIREDVWEPLVEKAVFDKAQKIAAQRWKDNRMQWAANHDAEPAANGPFLGRIFCGVCGRRLSRVRGGDPKTGGYFFYRCGTLENANGTGCVTGMREKRVMEGVRAALDYQVRLFAETGKRYGMDFFKKIEEESAQVMKKATERCEKAANRLGQLFEHYAMEVIDRQEYLAIKESYLKEQENAQKNLENTQKHCQEVIDRARAKMDWAEELSGCRGLTEISRETAERLVEKIVVESAGRIVVSFWFGDIFEERTDDAEGDAGHEI